MNARFSFAGRSEALHALGVEHVIVAMPFDLEERYTIIETLAREVMPRVVAGDDWRSELIVVFGG